jgi:hypothetical protein
MLLAFAGFTSAGDQPCEGTIVYRSGSEAYEQALSGIREALTGFPCRIQYLDLAGSSDKAPPLLPSQGLVTAVGLTAWERVLTANPSPNSLVLPALVLRDDIKRAPSVRRQGAVFADVPLLATLDKLREYFPGKNRIGWIHQPSWPVPDAATLGRVRQMGFQLTIVDCPGPEKLVTTFAALRGQVDFVIAVPDTGLYNGATVKSLILSSLEQRLPVIGFSSAFVRAGALMGVYPNFQDLGRQTGDLMAAVLSGKPAREEEVRSPSVAMNQRVMRLMGLEPAHTRGVEVMK